MSGGAHAKRLSALQDRLGHRFSEPKLLEQALSHASSQSNRLNSNERLEFLGDRVLGLAVTEMLYAGFPKETEGELGYRFTALVRKETLADVARALDIAPCLRMSPGEQNAGGHDNASILADACEALIGAVFLDAGYAVAAALVHHFWKPLAKAHTGPLKDAKTRLQERCQKAGLALPGYSVTGQSGPDHAPTFTITVTVEGRAPVSGTGSAKQEAEQAAAEAMLTAWENA
ncbi:MAG: ribonuclease III [Rhodospirillales bacterium]